MVGFGESEAEEEGHDGEECEKDDEAAAGAASRERGDNLVEKEKRASAR